MMLGYRADEIRKTLSIFEQREQGNYGLKG